MENRNFDYIIVGAGIGGLSSAVYLAQAGYKVLVLERHHKPGGYTHSFIRKGCTFDSAVRVIAGAQGEGLMSQMLKKMNIHDLESIELKKVYTAIYPDCSINVESGVDGLIRAYCNIYPNEREHIVKLVDEMSGIYYSTIEMLKSENPITIFSNSLYSKYANISFDEFLKKFIANDQLRCCLQAMCGYFGASPKKGSASYFSYAIMSFFIEGTYYIKGSFQKLSLRMVEELNKSHGRIVFNSEVKKIIYDKKEKKVCGVQLDNNKQYWGDTVIYNGDFRRLTETIIDTDLFPSRYLNRCTKIDLAMSAFEVFIETDMDIKNFLVSHETFVYDSYKYSEIYERHKRKYKNELDIHGIAISCPTLEDSDLCPNGHHLLVISTALGFKVEDDWDEVKKVYTDKLVELAEMVIPKLSSHILYMEAATPKTMNRYTLNTDGSCYGWEQNYDQLQYRPKQKTPIDGLYLVGHWTEPGGGVVAAMLSGYKIAKRLLERKEGS